MKTTKNIWFNYWQDDLPTIGSNYYHPTDYSWAKNILENEDKISKEVLSFIDLKDGVLKSHFYGEELESNTSWQTHSFKTWGIDVPGNVAECPFINEFLRQYPEVISASVNMLKAHSKIKVHRGDTNAIFRCHLGVVIPGTIPYCGFSVGDEQRSWGKGELIIFNDASEHYAWNDTDEDRIIFLFDVILPEYQSKTKSICIKVRSFLLLQYLSTKMKWLKKMPKFIHRFVYFMIKVFLYIIYPYQKKKGVLLKH